MTSWHEPKRPRDSQDWLNIFLLTLFAFLIVFVYCALGGIL